MRIDTELKLIEREIAANFSQSDWSAALLYAWRNGLSLGFAVAKAASFNKREPDEMWELALARAAAVVPSVAPYTILKQPVRVFIANNARLANDALWDGDYDKALKLFSKGGKRADSRTSARRDCRREEKLAMRGKLLAPARQEDKRSDWNTVK